MIDETMASSTIAVMRLGSSDWVAIASAVAAWLAAVFSYWSYRVSQRQLRLLESADTRLQPNLSIYLNRSLFLELEQGASRLYAFSISVSNLSDAPNSLVRAEFEIESGGSDAPLHVLKLPHEPGLGRILGSDWGRGLEFPVRLEARATISGWIFCRVPTQLLAYAGIGNYRLALTDALNKHASVQTSITTELIDETRMEKDGNHL
jgi:hypothetical protein